MFSASDLDFLLAPLRAGDVTELLKLAPAVLGAAVSGYWGVRGTLRLARVGWQAGASLARATAARLTPAPSELALEILDCLGDSSATTTSDSNGKEVLLFGGLQATCVPHSTATVCGQGGKGNLLEALSPRDRERVLAVLRQRFASVKEQDRKDAETRLAATVRDLREGGGKGVVLTAAQMRGPGRVV